MHRDGHETMLVSETTSFASELAWATHNIYTDRRSPAEQLNRIYGAEHGVQHVCEVCK